MGEDGKLIGLNKALADAGMPNLRVVKPTDPRPQKLNARYMQQATMRNLVDNVKRDGRLESVPLCAEFDGQLEIISGHHRIEAAKTAKLEQIVVMVIDVEGRDELRAKQLSHNAISGLDDDAVLVELYDSIRSLEMRYYSGLQDMIPAISLAAISFKSGEFREVTIAFVPEELVDLDEAMIAIERQSGVTSGTAVRLAPAKSFQVFADALRKVKRVEDIKSNAAGISRMSELAMDQIALLEAAKPKEEPKAKAAAKKPAAGGAKKPKASSAKRVVSRAG